MPRVSIITCTFNRAHLIGETIRSVIAQTMPDFEYLIVDDGSTDRTEEVVRSFNDKRISYFMLPNSNGHLSMLRNFGIRKSRGQFICFVDSDDLWLPDKLMEQVTLLEAAPRAHFSFTDIELFRGEQVLKKSLYKKSGVFTGSIFEEFVQNKFVICATTLLFRRECLEKTGYQDEALQSGDFDFILALATTFDAVAIYKPLVKVRKHDQNFSKRLPVHKAEGILASYRKLVDRNIVERTKLNKTLGRLCYSFAVEFARQGDHHHAITFLTKSIGFDFLFWKNYPRLLMALMKLSV